jgi:mRNA-degrading endonuclease RelE of RelBE toxin-antitoxin system
VVFIESKAFTRRLHELAEGIADSVLADIQSSLRDNPVRGYMVKGLGGIRKARISNPGRGKEKRGGFRYMYLYLERRSHIHLLFLIDKDEQEDLNPAQRSFLRQLVDRIKE